MKKDEKLDGRDFRIILALADNGMRTTDAARAAYMHRNTVIYHTDKIYRLTGLDAHNFYDLQKLVKIAKGGSNG